MIRHINLFAVIALLTGFAMASVHQHDIVIHNGDLIVENGDPECSMCDATFKINYDCLQAPSIDLQPLTDVIDRVLISAILPFEKITKERAPPARA